MALSFASFCTPPPARSSRCAASRLAALIPSPTPTRPPPAPTRSQSGLHGGEVLGGCRLRTGSALELNPRKPPTASTSGLGAPCEAAATQARLSQLMQKKEKSFGKVTIYHRCTLPALGTLCCSKAFLPFRGFCVSWKRSEILLFA